MTFDEYMKTDFINDVMKRRKEQASDKTTDELTDEAIVGVLKAVVEGLTVTVEERIKCK
jgi:hypothetical protein